MVTGINSFKTNNKFLSSGGRNVRGFNKRYADNKYLIEPDRFFKGSLLKNSGGTNTDTTNADTTVKYSTPKLSLNNLYKYTNFKFEHFKDKFSKASFFDNYLIVNSDNPFLKACNSMKQAIRDCGAPALNGKKGEPDWNVFAEKLISSLKHVKGKDSYDKLASNEELLRKASHNVFIKSNMEFLKSMLSKGEYTSKDKTRLKECYQSLFEYNLALAKTHTLNERLVQESSANQQAQINKNIEKQKNKIDTIFNKSKQHKHLVDRSVNIMRFNSKYKEFNELYSEPSEIFHNKVANLNFKDENTFFKSVKDAIKNSMKSNSFEHKEYFKPLMTDSMLKRMTMHAVINSKSPGDLNDTLNSIKKSYDKFIDQLKQDPNPEMYGLTSNKASHPTVNNSADDIAAGFKKIITAAGVSDNDQFNNYIQKAATNVFELHNKHEMFKSNLCFKSDQLKENNLSLDVLGLGLGEADSFQDFFTSVKSEIKNIMESASSNHKEYFKPLITDRILNKMTMNAIQKSDNLNDLGDKFNLIREGCDNFNDKLNKRFGSGSETENVFQPKMAFTPISGNVNDTGNFISKSFEAITEASGFKGDDTFKNYISEKADSLFNSSTK